MLTCPTTFMIHPKPVFRPNRSNQMHIWKLCICVVCLLHHKLEYKYLTMKEEITVQLLHNSNNNNNIDKLYEGDDHGVGPPTDASSSSSSSSFLSSSFTPMLLLSAFIAVLGSFSFGFVIGYTSPVQTQIMKELDLSTAEFSLFGSMISIGGLFGAVLCGKIADYIGRKHAVRLFALIYIFGWISISVCQVAWLLDLGRCMLGFAAAIAGYVIPVYLAEFAPKNLRGGFLVLYVLMIALGTSTVYLLGLVTSWRTLALIGMIPSVVQVAGSFFIPESPRWLMMMGKNEEFEAALQCLRGVSADALDEAASIRESIEALNEIEKVSILELPQMKYAYALTLGVGLSTFTCLVGISGVVFYASSIFNAVGFSVTVGTIELALFQLPSVVLGMFLTDRCGRRPLLMTSAAGLCLGCLLTGFAFLFEEHQLLDGVSPYIALIGVLIYVASYQVGMAGACPIVVSEIFPLNVKGSAGSLITVITQLGGWIVSYAFNFSMEWSSSGTFFILAGNCALTLIFVAKLLPETKGKTLEEVHLSISQVWQ